MRMISSWKKDKRGTDASPAIPVAAESAPTIDLSVINCTANKTRDDAWKIGDQAMKKTDLGMTWRYF